MSDLNLDGLTDAQMRLLAVRCVRRVQHLMTDPRSVAALDVAERHAKGEATDAELEEAWAAAEDAADAAPWTAAAADAADAAAGVVWSNAFAAVRAATFGARWAVSRGAARDAQAAAWDTELAWQQKILEEVRNNA